MSAIKGVFTAYFRFNLLYKILIGLLLGSVAGIIFQNNADMVAFLKPFGDIFVRLLKMIMVPVIACTLIVGASTISPSHLSRVGGKIVIFYLVTSLFAIVIGLLSGHILEPGVGLDFAGAEGKTIEAKTPSLSSIFLNIIPTNPMELLQKEMYSQLFSFACFSGLHLHTVKIVKMNF